MKVLCCVLQCVAVSRCVLRCVGDRGEGSVDMCCSMLQCAAVRGSMLQCVAVCGIVLQCVGDADEGGMQMYMHTQ